MTYYADSPICLTTKHNKQQVIAPVFSKHLKAQVICCELDTDTLGTFSGEIARKGSALETAREKCVWGLETTKMQFGIASEGSFGAHPVMHFLPCNQELLYFIDRKSDFHIYEQITSSRTNYKMQTIKSISELIEFANQVRYPSHALIVRSNKPINNTIVYKGITLDEKLYEAFDVCMHNSYDHQVWVETDMRAHMNPTRMSVIEELAIKLATRLNNVCNKCKIPGWGITRVESGLECIDCGLATDMFKYEIFSCSKCRFEERRHRSDGLSYADPGSCYNCNP